MTTGISWLRHGATEPTLKSYRSATHRTVDPATTLARLKPLLGPLGITRVANVTGLDHIGIPVVMVCRPNSKSLAVSQGKGLSVDAAKVSGIMESLELAHAERIHAPLRLASPEVMEKRERVATLSSLPQRASSRLRPGLEMLWIEAHDLLREKNVWLPYEMVTMSSSLPLPPGSGCFLGSSNGLASGNHWLEATSHALCELVERDATSLWHARPTALSAERLLDLDSVDDPCCRELVERCTAADVRLLVWDITSDIALPVFACFLVEPSALRRIRSTSLGYGCHVDRGVALFRSISEAVQSRLTYIAGSRDDLFRRDYEDKPKLRDDIARLETFLAIAPRRRFADAPSHRHDTFDDDVALELELIRGAGCPEVLALDLSDPDFGIPVVRVVVPGLEAVDSHPDYVMGERARRVQQGVS